MKYVASQMDFQIALFIDGKVTRLGAAPTASAPQHLVR